MDHSLSLPFHPPLVFSLLWHFWKAYRAQKRSLLYYGATVTSFGNPTVTVLVAFDRKAWEVSNLAMKVL